MANKQLFTVIRHIEVLHAVKEKRNVLHGIKRRKANFIGHILRRNCFLRHIIEGNIEGMMKVTGRKGRRRKHLLGDVKERRGLWILKAYALGRTLCSYSSWRRL